MSSSRQLFVCQHTSCQQQGAAIVLRALHTELLAQGHDHDLRFEITIEPCGCLGHCGEGPNVMMLPGHIWYSHVQPGDAAVICAASVTIPSQPLSSPPASPVTPSDSRSSSSMLWLVMGVGLGAIAALISGGLLYILAKP